MCGPEDSGVCNFNTSVKMKKGGGWERGQMWENNKELVNLSEDILSCFPL